MLEEATGIVEKGIQQGRTAEQMKQAKVLAKFDEWGKGFIKTDGFIDEVYNALKGIPKNPS
jgi:cyclase